jgi:hypothetical protein
MCTVLLPPGVNPIAVNKYIVSCRAFSCNYLHQPTNLLNKIHFMTRINLLHVSAKECHPQVIFLIKGILPQHEFCGLVCLFKSFVNIDIYIIVNETNDNFIYKCCMLRPSVHTKYSKVLQDKRLTSDVKNSTPNSDYMPPLL